MSLYGLQDNGAIKWARPLWSIPSQDDGLCPVCGAGQQHIAICGHSLSISVPRRARFFNRNGGLHLFESTLRRCPSCTMGYLHPRPSNEELAEHYKNAASLHSVGSPEAFQAAVRNPHHQAYATSILQWLSDVIPGAGDTMKEGYCMDVGCNAGWFLDVAHKAGLKPLGIEVDPSICALNTEIIGCEMFCGMVDMMPAEFEQSASLIVMNDTLEHHTDPLNSLQTAYRMSKPGGLVFINVPNLLYWKAQHNIETWEWFESDHLMYFQESSIKAAFERCGFVDVVTEVGEWSNTPVMLMRAAIDATPEMLSYIGAHRMKEKLWCVGRRP